MKRNKGRERVLETIRDLERLRKMLDQYSGGPRTVITQDQDKRDLDIYLRGFDFAVKKLREFA